MDSTLIDETKLKLNNRTHFDCLGVRGVADSAKGLQAKVQNEIVHL